MNHSRRSFAPNLSAFLLEAPGGGLSFVQPILKASL